MQRKLTPPAVRFWRHVTKTDGCWLWTGARRPTGYGAFNGPGGITVRAHRYAYELAYGAIADDAIVCHTCDNPPCVRPDHLFLGTVQDNVADRQAKGRSPKGEQHGIARLSAEDVTSIRTLYASGRYLQRELAEMYATTQGRISIIVRGKQWRHLTT
jgi:hypothetical protein